MVNFCVVLKFVYFVFAIFDLLHDLESVFLLPHLRTACGNIF